MQHASNHTAIPDGAASLLVAALEQVWQSIRRRHPDVPEAVLVVASGAAGKRLNLGHFAPRRWQVAGADRHEVLVGGEGLQRGALEVLGTLLHEAAHGMAQARGVQDTSRAGRYHNRRYASLARELGLDVANLKPIGWSATTVPEQTAAGYAASSRSWRRRWCCGVARNCTPPAAAGRGTCWPAPAHAAAGYAPPAPPWPRRRSSAAPASNRSSPQTPTKQAIDV